MIKWTVPELQLRSANSRCAIKWSSAICFSRGTGSYLAASRSWAASSCSSSSPPAIASKCTAFLNSSFVFSTYRGSSVLLLPLRARTPDEPVFARAQTHLVPRRSLKLVGVELSSPSLAADAPFARRSPFRGFCWQRLSFGSKLVQLFGHFARTG